MKMLRTLNMRRFGLILVLLCLCSLPRLAGAAAPVPQVPTGPRDILGNWATPDYYTTANWANSPPLAKFVDALPGLTGAKKNLLGQYLSVGKPDITTYPGSDYYEIELVEYRQRMHSDLPATIGPTTGSTTGTLLRGYVQVNKGTDTSTCGGNLQPPCSTAHNTLTPDPVHYLGPNIVALRDRPVRIKFTNKLPLTANGGNLFIPVDVTVMGAGVGPADASGAPCDSTAEPNTCASYTQNRSDIHLHGGRTPWISDGTPHQWITPAGEITPFKSGVSLQNVPDMPDPGEGSTTYYYTNQQSARLMFYHEHAWGITRLNPYVGVAAGYLITDQWEQDLIQRGILPPFLDQIPLIIQDRTFVDARPAIHPVTGEQTTMVRLTDPLWNWGSAAPDPTTGIRPPVTGDLWLPHVYMPAQTQVAGAGGTNPFGRWMYGPWFYPATVISKGPVANPYYDPNCSSPNPFELALCQTPGQPTQIPGTPNVSMGMEAFQDSAVVNGTAFPSLTVDPRAYRFRILNAANDRFWNLSFYKADPAQLSPDPRPASRLTEVKMAPASASLAAANNWPPLWPVDGREGGVPDPGSCTTVAGKLTCPNLGPSFLQIGTEGGFLPQPVEVAPQPITYNTDPTAFWVGNVNKMALALGPAERADVIVDFSQYAGQTLILYNDAPAAWPAGVVTYDYYTGAPDLRDIGGYGTGGTFDPATGTWVGGSGPLAGYAPNTRTVMQVIVRATAGTDPPYTFSRTALEQEFTAAAPVTLLNPAPTKTLFERSQEPIIVGQAAYSTTYPASYFPTNFPWEGIAQINDQSLNFVTLAGQQVNVPTEPKGLHDEMGASFDPIYGRMSGNLGMQLPNPTSLTALLVLYGFSDVPSEHINNSTSVNVEVLPGIPAGIPGTVADGTQIWKISHNGVDTHPIHFHIFDVQLINRVGWDGQILMPELNELGWKDTVKISPLEDTIVAVRPRAPALPFGIPNSLRPLNPAIPIDSVMGFTTPTTGSDWPIPMNNGTIGSGFSSIDWVTGGLYGVAPSLPPYPHYKGVVTNVLYDFGWEYVWHCHILSHEEMDMMRPIVLNYAAALPPAFSATGTPGGGRVNLSWNDPTPVTYTDLTTYGNPANEIGFNVYRTTGGTLTRLNPATLRANSTGYTHIGGTGSDTYIVEAFNAKGSTFAYVGTAAPAITVTATGPFAFPAGNITLDAVISGLTAGLVTPEVAFYDGTTLLGTDTTAPYSFVWSTATMGTHSITARVTNLQGLVSAPISVTVTGALTANFTPNDGATFNVCDVIPFTSTSTGSITGYSWLINGASYTTPSVNKVLPQGVYPVTLGIVNSATGFTSQVSKTITVANNHLPTAIPGGPYSVTPGNSLVLNGSATDPDACDVPSLAYAWDVDNKNGYEFFTANPTIPYDALLAVLGVGTHTMTLRVTDPSGGVATAATTVTLGTPTVRMNSRYFYPSLQSAYDAAANNALIEHTVGAAAGGFVANKNITVTLSGGMDSGFAALSGVTTIPATVTLQKGKVVMRNIRLMSPYPMITTASPLPVYTIGSGAYSVTLAAAGGRAPYRYLVTAGALPAGLTLASGGLLSGTPTTPGSYNFTVTVTDSAGTPLSSSTAFTLVVSLPAPLVITTPSPLTSYTIGTGAYTTTIAATGGVAPLSFSTADTLPAGLTLSTIGTLSGTPTTPGTYNFTVTVTDSTVSAAVTTSKAFQLVVIQPAPLAITSSSPLPGYTTGTGTYTTTITASGGVGTYSFAVTAGTLPAGLALSSAGTLSGTPTTAGTYNFTITVTDSTLPTAATAGKAFQLTVIPSLAITTASPLPSYSIASGPINLQFAASGGVPPYTFASAGFTGLGFTFSTSGLLTGTPPLSSTGTWSIPVTVTDSATTPVTTTKNFLITISP